jgi:hypothetical protein
MNDRTPGEFARDCLAEARNKGIADPVILALSSQSEPARAIYEDLHGHPMAPAESGNGHEFGPCEVLPAAEAQRLLRRHGDADGGQVADLLGDPFLTQRVRPDFWFVGLLEGEIHARAFLDGEEVWHVVTGYYRVRGDCQTPSQLAADPGPSLVKLRLEGGGVLPVCGPTGSDAIMARALAVIAKDRVIDTEHEGTSIQMPVDDDMLASLLLDVYGARPRAIAETIMALKKLPGGKHAWLAKVLGERPELARRVEHELTGE